MVSAGVLVKPTTTDCSLYQRLLAPTHIGPIAHADGSYRVWRLCELFPCLACCFDNGVIMVEDAVGEPVGAHILPDVLHRVQLGRARGQEDRLYVRGHFELAGRMPSRPVHEQHSHRSLGDVARDFVKMELHRLGIGVRQSERCAFSVSRADGAEEIDVLVALVGGLPGP